MSDFDFSDDDDPDDRPRSRPKRGGRRCPFCGSRAAPVFVQKISPIGWIVFIFGIWLCLLGLIGLFLKRNVRVCPDCGHKL